MSDLSLNILIGLAAYGVLSAVEDFVSIAEQIREIRKLRKEIALIECQLNKETEQ